MDLRQIARCFRVTLKRVFTVKCDLTEITIFESADVYRLVEYKSSLKALISLH